MAFNENLVRARKGKGFSQEELAKRIGITRQSVSKWENGDAMPDFGNIQQLANVLEVSLDTLFTLQSATVRKAARRFLRRRWKSRTIFSAGNRRSFAGSHRPLSEERLVCGIS